MPSPLRAAVVVGSATVAVLAGVTAATVTPASALGGATLSVASLSPTYGLVGSALDIHGSGFAAGDTVAIGSSSAVPVSATEVSSDGDDITLDVPKDATSGAVTVTDALTKTTVSGPAFTVQRVARSTASVSHRVVTAPHGVRVVARLTYAGRPVKGQHARLQLRHAGSTAWHHVGGTKTHTTGHRGMVSFRVTPAGNLAYRVVFAASHAYTRNVTGAHEVGVHALLHVDVPNGVSALEPFSITGSVTPALSGKLFLERKVNGRWHRLHHVTPHHGRFHTSLTVAKPGLYRYRIIRPGDVHHLSAIGATHVVKATLRDLSSGDHGSDVTRLQKRLKHLHYDVGAVNGTFGYDTLHAVTAFQKVQGFTRSGKVTQKVWKRLAHPKVPHLRHPIHGTTAIEVDLARQVVLFAKDGHITRIIDASSAGGYYYTDSEGQREKAVTPTGHFTIQYKINGWHKSKLGELYRPAYFTNTGYAIHGETSVPNYPASHGCVRITVPAMDRLYDKIYVGMSVWIYS